MFNRRRLRRIDWSTIWWIIGLSLLVVLLSAGVLGFMFDGVSAQGFEDETAPPVPTAMPVTSATVWIRQDQIRVVGYDLRPAGRIRVRLNTVPRGDEDLALEANIINSSTTFGASLRGWQTSQGPLVARNVNLIITFYDGLADIKTLSMPNVALSNSFREFIFSPTRDTATESSVVMAPPDMPLNSVQGGITCTDYHLEGLPGTFWSAEVRDVSTSPPYEFLGRVGNDLPNISTSHQWSRGELELRRGHRLWMVGISRVNAQAPTMTWDVQMKLQPSCQLPDFERRYLPLISVASAPPLTPTATATYPAVVNTNVANPPNCTTGTCTPTATATPTLKPSPAPTEPVTYLCEFEPMGGTCTPTPRPTPSTPSASVAQAMTPTPVRAANATGEPVARESTPPALDPAPTATPSP